MSSSYTFLLDLLSVFGKYPQDHFDAFPEVKEWVSTFLIVTCMGLEAVIKEPEFRFPAEYLYYKLKSLPSEEERVWNNFDRRVYSQLDEVLKHYECFNEKTSSLPFPTFPHSNGEYTSFDAAMASAEMETEEDKDIDEEEESRKRRKSDVS